ncbi:MAG TPA: SIS domain-containing protein [Acidimicrobiia bacterium]|nr:SIS domain-containing protein [Acidimicrobiia bacterium]
MSAATEFDRRVGPGSALSAEAGAIAHACADVAARFHAGGKLVVFGNGAGATDAAHVAVEFVHPVIVGKRALPALSLSNDAAALTGLAESHGLSGIYAAQLGLGADPGDIALGICVRGPVESVLRGLATARRLGLLTVALTGRDPWAEGMAIPADHVLRVESDDPRIVKEIHVTMYHVLWELVHVFLEQPAVLAGRDRR